jgi:hypothetical protein
MFSPPESALEISGVHLKGAIATEKSPGFSRLVLTLDETGRSDLLKWIGESAPGTLDLVLVSVDENALDAIPASALRAMNGLVMVNTSNERLGGIRSHLAVSDVPNVGPSPETCEAIAGDDPKLKEHCLEILRADPAEEEAALRRVESQLESEDPDYDAALRDLGVDPTP